MKRGVVFMRAMFNPTQKKEYIEYENKNEVPLTNYFARIYKGEIKYDKDISDMSKEELIDTLCMLNIRREETRNHLLSLLRGYIKWTKLMDKTDNDSPIDQLTGENIGRIDTLASQMIKSPEQIEEILSIVIDNGKSYQNQPNRASRDKLVFWLIYSGLRISDLMELQKTDIDYENKLVYCKKVYDSVDNDGNKITRYKDKEYEVNDSILYLWREYVSVDCLEHSGVIEEYGLVNNDFLFRAVESIRYPYAEVEAEHLTRDVQPYNSFSMILKKIFKIYSGITGEKMDVKPDSLKCSGVFYRTYAKEKGGEKYSLEILAKNLGLEYNDEEDKMMMRKWDIDYHDWKVAFGYM